ncbi:DegQ family serine endoprotease [uncultured Parasutterella sp.]|jgi:serine protease Do|uniref:DegQ family serine endoprotease n=1 Tax=uncultured Parasutterella sp. TaxID=1263098 RepID=UPI0025F8953F|nr:DegQ family serine endoprotease [uncultured Parasutterella sp.]
MFFNKLLKPAVLTIACAAALTAGSFGNVSVFPEAHAQTSQFSGLPDFTKLVEDNGKAVVSISTVKKAKRVGPQNGMPDEQLEMLRRFGFPFPFGDFNGPGMTPERRGQGSGFIIDPNGIILTNNHVVDGADEVTVHLTDKREFKAKVLGTDPKTDIAVIKIEGKDLPVVKLGKSENVKVGEWVAAIGAPFGLDNTVTAGIVSAKSRNLPDEQFVPFIQTDVAVNPGNSGGPLFNMKGEVIGINSQIFSTSGGFMGLSFAIPIDLAVQIKDELMKNGKVSRGRLGILMQQLTPELAKSFNLKEAKGALIAQIEKNGPADKAGLRDGDIVIEYNGKPIADIRELSQAVASTKPGAKVKVKAMREGKPVNLVIVVGEMPTDGKLNFKKPAASQNNALGANVRPLNDKEKKRVSNGLFVESVYGAAAEAGMRRGDIIISAGGKKIRTEKDLNEVVSKAKGSLAVLVDRNGSREFIPVKLSDEVKK